VFGKIFKWAPVGVCHYRVGDDGISLQHRDCPKRSAPRLLILNLKSIFVTPTPKVLFSIAVEALESVILRPAGGKVGIPNSTGW